MENKQCCRCSTVKTVGEFYKSKCAKDGLSRYCRDCCKIVQKEWATNNRERKRAINKKWVERHSERRKAMNRSTNALWRAIRAGNVIRGTTCETCGSGQTIEACHDDYNQPLKVKWLCIKCHRLWDAKDPKTRSKFISSS